MMQIPDGLADHPVLARALDPDFLTSPALDDLNSFHEAVCDLARWHAVHVEHALPPELTGLLDRLNDVVYDVLSLIHQGRVL